MDRNNEYIGVCQVTRYARNLTYGWHQMTKYHVGQVFPRLDKNKPPFKAPVRLDKSMPIINRKAGLPDTLPRMTGNRNHWSSVFSSF